MTHPLERWFLYFAIYSFIGWVYESILCSVAGKKLVNRAYLTLVALDDSEKPTPVPRLQLETEEERAEWEAGVKRAALRKQRRIEQF